MSRRIRSLADLQAAAAAGRATLYPSRLKILVGSASCGVAVGARAVEAAARRAVDQLGLDAAVCRTGCIGFCAKEPLLDLVLPNGPRVSYAHMTPEKTLAVLEAYASRQDLKPELALGRFEREEHVSTGGFHQYPPCPPQFQAVPEWSGLDFYRRQRKVILRNCGSIDPMSLEETIARGTYRGAVRALTQMTPEAVIDEMVQSGLRGRGGAAFPTGQKWRLAQQAPADVKYVVCNADEGEPGACMDRTVLEGDSHAVLEGMLIGSYAVGASEGFIYVRSEYPLAIDTEDRDGETIMIGTGGIIVLDDAACMVDMAQFLVGFFLEESCGKCVPCREGTRQMHRILTRICGGNATAADLGLLERLARTVRSAAVCGMGGMAPGAVLTTLGHFRDEFEAHVRRGECPAGVCRDAGAPRLAAVS